MLFNRTIPNGQLVISRSPREIVDVASEHSKVRPPEQASAAAPASTVIGPTLSLHGNLQSTDDVRVWGQITGDICCAHLTVAPGGTVVGNIVADEIVVHGTVKGIIRANFVTLQAGAHVESEIINKMLVIEKGAHFEGVSRRREEPTRMIEEEIIAAAAAAGADPIALKHLVRPLLALPDSHRGDPVTWAKELALAAQDRDSDVLREAVNRIVAKSNWCPAIIEIVEECEKIDREIGGQRTLCSAMYQMYALGNHTWDLKWGPLPGERGCRLRRDLQDDQWRKIIEFVRASLAEDGWVDEPAGLIGAKLVQVLEQNSGVSLDSGAHCAIPRKIRSEFGMPVTAKLAKAARTLLADLEQRSSRPELESQESWRKAEIVAA
jgi:cytoskeletal protein CcmA (bactofilin family)